MSRLNYSKWDNLELSDDSDVEVHPNVDKKSFIKWKQRDIHEKRETRKQELAAYRTELGFNDTLEPLLKELTDSTKSQGHQYFSREVSRLTAGRAERGNKDGPTGPTTDDMLLSLLLQINEEPSVKGKADAELDQALVAKLVEHQGRLKARSLQLKADIQRIEEEDKKKITSEGLKEGFSSSHIAKPEPEEPAPAPKKKAQSKKTTTSSIETLNTPSSSSGPSSITAAQFADSDAEDDEEEVPDLTPMTKAFGLLPPCIPSFFPLTLSQLPPNFTPKQLDGKPFSAALEFLSSHRLLLRDDSDTSDALLVEAFQSQMRGEAKRSRGFVEKGLMIQYLTKLGKDGVSLFFRRMASADGKAVTVFFNDVLSTYRRIADRCEVLKKEEAEGVAGAGEEKEQIQLVAEDPSTVITFEVPEGPPPENIQIELPEDDPEGERPELDVEQIRLFLQRRWDIFISLEEEMQAALRSHELEQVNAVLGKMKVQRAEEVVGLLDQGGILNFGSGGAEVRDETGK